MYVFLENEREGEGESEERKKDGKYLLNSVAMLHLDWLYEEEKRNEKRTLILLPSFIG